VMVDGVEQNEMVASFGMRRDAAIQVTRWTSDDECDVMQASHTGYRRLRHPVTHRRTVVFAKRPFAMLVLDTIDGEAEHAVESAVHLAPGGELRAVPAEVSEARVEEAIDWLRAQAGAETAELARGKPVTFARLGVRLVLIPLGWGDFRTDGGWYSERYGRRTPSTVLRLETSGGLPLTGGFLILPEDAA
jgi:Heparinase II/III-like protein